MPRIGDKTTQITFRLTATSKDREIIESLAELWGCSLSDAIRTACRMAEVQVKRARG